MGDLEEDLSPTPTRRAKDPTLLMHNAIRRINQKHRNSKLRNVTKSYYSHLLPTVEPRAYYETALSKHLFASDASKCRPQTTVTSQLVIKLNRNEDSRHGNNRQGIKSKGVEDVGHLISQDNLSREETTHQSTAMKGAPKLVAAANSGGDNMDISNASSVSKCNPNYIDGDIKHDNEYFGDVKSSPINAKRVRKSSRTRSKDTEYFSNNVKKDSKPFKEDKQDVKNGPKSGKGFSRRCRRHSKDKHHSDNKKQAEKYAKIDSKRLEVNSLDSDAESSEQMTLKNDKQATNYNLKSNQQDFKPFKGDIKITICSASKDTYKHGRKSGSKKDRNARKSPNDSLKNNHRSKTTNPPEQTTETDSKDDQNALSFLEKDLQDRKHIKKIYGREKESNYDSKDTDNRYLEKVSDKSHRLNENHGDFTPDKNNSKTDQFDVKEFERELENNPYLKKCKKHEKNIRNVTKKSENRVKEPEKDSASSDRSEKSKRPEQESLSGSINDEKENDIKEYEKRSNSKKGKNDDKVTKKDLKHDKIGLKDIEKESEKACHSKKNKSPEKENERNSKNDQNNLKELEKDSEKNRQSKKKRSTGKEIQSDSKFESINKNESKETLEKNIFDKKCKANGEETQKDSKKRKNSVKEFESNIRCKKSESHDKRAKRVSKECKNIVKDLDKEAEMNSHCKKSHKKNHCKQEINIDLKSAECVQKESENNTKSTVGSKMKNEKGKEARRKNKEIERDNNDFMVGENDITQNQKETQIKARVAEWKNIKFDCSKTLTKKEKYLSESNRESLVNLTGNNKRNVKLRSLSDISLSTNQHGENAKIYLQELKKRKEQSHDILGLPLMDIPVSRNCSEKQKSCKIRKSILNPNVYNNNNNKHRNRGRGFISSTFSLRVESGGETMIESDDDNRISDREKDSEETTFQERKGKSEHDSSGVCINIECKKRRGQILIIRDDESTNPSVRKKGDEVSTSDRNSSRWGSESPRRGHPEKSCLKRTPKTCFSGKRDKEVGFGKETKLTRWSDKPICQKKDLKVIEDLPHSTESERPHYIPVRHERRVNGVDPRSEYGKKERPMERPEPPENSKPDKGYSKIPLGQKILCDIRKLSLPTLEIDEMKIGWCNLKENDSSDSGSLDPHEYNGSKIEDSDDFSPCRMRTDDRWKASRSSHTEGRGTRRKSQKGSFTSTTNPSLILQLSEKAKGFASDLTASFHSSSLCISCRGEDLMLVRNSSSSVRETSLSPVSRGAGPSPKPKSISKHDDGPYKPSQACEKLFGMHKVQFNKGQKTAWSAPPKRQESVFQPLPEFEKTPKGQGSSIREERNRCPGDEDGDQLKLRKAIPYQHISSSIREKHQLFAHDEGEQHPFDHVISDTSNCDLCAFTKDSIPSYSQRNTGNKGPRSGRATYAPPSNTSLNTNSTDDDNKNATSGNWDDEALDPSIFLSQYSSNNTNSRQGTPKAIMGLKNGKLHVNVSENSETATQDGGAMINMEEFDSISTLSSFCMGYRQEQGGRTRNHKVQAPIRIKSKKLAIVSDDADSSCDVLPPQSARVQRGPKDSDRSSRSQRNNSDPHSREGRRSLMRETPQRLSPFNQRVSYCKGGTDMSWLRYPTPRRTTSRNQERSICSPTEGNYVTCKASGVRTKSPQVDTRKFVWKSPSNSKMSRSNGGFMSPSLVAFDMKLACLHHLSTASTNLDVASSHHLVSPKRHSPQTFSHKAERSPRTPDFSVMEYGDRAKGYEGSKGPKRSSDSLMTNSISDPYIFLERMPLCRFEEHSPVREARFKRKSAGSKRLK